MHLTDITLFTMNSFCQCPVFLRGPPGNPNYRFSMSLIAWIDRLVSATLQVRAP